MTTLSAHSQNCPPAPLKVEANLKALGNRVVKTPVWCWSDDRVVSLLGAGSEVWLKLELWQRCGSFKARGALTVLMHASQEELARGVTAVSAGNHAIAVSYAAREFGTNATVVMPCTANPLRIARCREYGATVELVDDVFRAFERVKEIEQSEGRLLVHPFEGPLTALATASIGLEMLQQMPILDAVIVPIGGGGLCGGVASYIKQIMPTVALYGVEPSGAASMSVSIKAGSPQKLERVETIADSLGAPFALPYSFGLCRDYLDQIVTVSDSELQNAMRELFLSLRLAIEPAAAAGLAAAIGPLKERLAGKKVALIICGSSIDDKRWHQLIAEN